MLFSAIITFLVVCFGLLWSLVVKLTLVVEGIVVLIAAQVVTTI